MNGLESGSASDVSDRQGCQKQRLESIVILSTLNTFFYLVLRKATFLCVLHLPLGCLQAWLYCKAVLLVSVVGGNN